MVISDDDDKMVERFVEIDGRVLSKAQPRKPLTLPHKGARWTEKLKVKSDICLGLWHAKQPAHEGS